MLDCLIFDCLIAAKLISPPSLSAGLLESAADANAAPLVERVRAAEPLTVAVMAFLGAPPPLPRCTHALSTPSILSLYSDASHVYSPWAMGRQHGHPMFNWRMPCAAGSAQVSCFLRRAS